MHVDKSKPGGFIAQASGVYSTEKYLKLIRRLLLDPDGQKGTNTLIDFRNVCFEKACLNDVYKLTDVARVIDKAFSPNKCAFILPEKSVILGLYYRHAVASKVAMTTKIFSPNTSDHAYQWVKE